MTLLTGFYLRIGEGGFLVFEDRPESCKFFVADYYSPPLFNEAAIRH